MTPGRLPSFLGQARPCTWTSVSEMVARYLASRLMAMALMPLPCGQLSNMVCTGMLQGRGCWLSGVPAIREGSGAYCGSMRAAGIVKVPAPDFL